MDWKSLIGSVAPTLATALGGPLAVLAVQAIGQAVGMDQPTVKKVQDALTQGQLTGDQIVQLKQAEQLLQQKMRELDISEEQLYANDRDSARKREMSVQDWTPRIIAYGMLGGFLGMAFAVLFGQVKADTVLAGTVIGYLSAKAEQIIAYYFGSTSGSAMKTQLLANSVPADQKKG